MRIQVLSAEDFEKARLGHGIPPEGLWFITGPGLDHPHWGNVWQDGPGMEACMRGLGLVSPAEQRLRFMKEHPMHGEVVLDALKSSIHRVYQDWISLRKSGEPLQKAPVPDFSPLLPLLQRLRGMPRWCEHPRAVAEATRFLAVFTALVGTGDAEALAPVATPLLESIREALEADPTQDALWQAFASLLPFVPASELEALPSMGLWECACLLPETHALPLIHALCTRKQYLLLQHLAQRSARSLVTQAAKLPPEQARQLRGAAVEWSMAGLEASRMLEDFEALREWISRVHAWTGPDFPAYLDELQRLLEKTQADLRMVPDILREQVRRMRPLAAPEWPGGVEASPLELHQAGPGWTPAEWNLVLQGSEVEPFRIRIRARSGGRREGEVLLEHAGAVLARCGPTRSDDVERVRAALAVFEDGRLSCLRKALLRGLAPRAHRRLHMSLLSPMADRLQVRDQILDDAAFLGELPPQGARKHLPREALVVLARKVRKELEARLEAFPSEPTLWRAWADSCQLTAESPGRAGQFAATLAIWREQETWRLALPGEALRVILSDFRDGGQFERMADWCRSLRDRSPDPAIRELCVQLMKEVP